MTRNKATAYLVIQAKRSNWGPRNPETGLKAVDSLRIDRIRVERPATLARDEIAVKVTIDVPDSAFLPVTPTAEVVVPEDLALRGPIEVEAVDANEEQE